MKNSNQTITIIADNGGGATLQLTDGNEKYQHSYNECCEQVVTDIKSFLVEGFEGWDGNDLNEDVCWITPTINEIANGGYKIFEISTLNEAIKVIKEIS